MLILGQLAGMFTNAGLAAAGVAAVVVPIVIHLLTRMRRQQQMWGAMRFLQMAYRRHRKWVKMEQWLLLTVRCLILVVLGLALAGPLLGGCAGKLAGGLDTTGRVVYVVVDDSLSTQAVMADGESRFSKLRDAAVKVVAGLDAIDEVSVWRAGREGGAVLEQPTTDHKAAVRAIEMMEPGYGRADFSEVFGQVGDQLAQRDLPGDRVLVVVLSDLSGDSFDLGKAASQELASLSEQARFLFGRPMVSGENLQVSWLQPRRFMVVQRGAMGGAVVSAELGLRRYGEMTGGEVAAVEMVVEGADGVRYSQAGREVSWAVGQREATVSVDMPLQGLGAADGGGRILTVGATVRGSGGADVLARDNQRWSVVELKEQLTVGVIGGEMSRFSSDQGFTARIWLRLGLNPTGDGQAGVEVVDLAVSDLGGVNGGGIKGYDALMVVRPDILDGDGWRALGDYANGGGQVWVFAPAMDQPGVWGSALIEQLGDGWQVGMEPMDGQWVVDREGVCPDELQLLSADWESLLGPIRVNRRVDIQIREASNGVWMRLDDEQGTPLIAAKAVGDGSVVFVATALDTGWSNLVTKPLFVPLLHEGLRGLAGNAGSMSKLNEVVCGDRPVLGRSWDGAQRLVSVDGRTTMVLQRSDAGLMPVGAMAQPGVYISQTAGGGSNLGRLAVNVDSIGGDTLTLDSDRFADWLSRVGTWGWIDLNEPVKSLARQTPRTNVGWPLLWMVLALMVAESVLAYWFSHGTTEGSAWLRGSWIGRIVMAFKGEAA